MNINNYEQQALALDKELAEMLGWTDIAESCKYGKPPNRTGILSCPISRWTQDDAEAFRLMVNYKITLHVGAYFATCFDVDMQQSSSACFAEFPDKLSAVRYAIVQATINKLKESNK